MVVYDKAEKLKEVLGVGGLLNEMLQALSVEEFDDVADYIARMHDVDFEEGDNGL